MFIVRSSIKKLPAFQVNNTQWTTNQNNSILDPLTTLTLTINSYCAAT